MTGTGTLAGVHSSVETLTDSRIKLTIELDEAEFETEVEAAFKRIAREVRIPGFRPGRAPAPPARGADGTPGGPGRGP